MDHEAGAAGEPLKMSAVLNHFLAEAPDGCDRTLHALCLAESLTDSVAREIYALEPIEGIGADLFLEALRQASFTVPRNSEWHFTQEARAYFHKRNTLPKARQEAVHRLLIDRAAMEHASSAGSLIPSYLFTSVGRAYHGAALGQVPEALEAYSKAAMHANLGEQWLAAQLAEEQEREGFLPKGAIETIFLRAMVFYREGETERALRLFQRLENVEEDRLEVAIALAILGSRTPRNQPQLAEIRLRRAIKIGSKFREFRLAHPLLSLANVLARSSRQRAEAEELYRRTIEVEAASGTSTGLAKSLHGYANMLAHQPRRRREAEQHYKRGISLLRPQGLTRGLAEMLHSLARLVAKDSRRHAEAEQLYVESRRAGEALNYRKNLVQVLHDLGHHIGRDPSRSEEAETLLRESLRLGGDDDNHVAQVLNWLAMLIYQQDGRRQEAEEMLLQSLAINRHNRNARGEAVTLRSLGLVVASRSVDEAARYLQSSLKLYQSGADARGAERIRELLSRIVNRGLK